MTQSLQFLDETFLLRKISDYAYLISLQFYIVSDFTTFVKITWLEIGYAFNPQTFYMLVMIKRTISVIIRSNFAKILQRERLQLKTYFIILKEFHYVLNAY